MAMHVASRHGGWNSVFLRIANAACSNAKCVTKTSAGVNDDATSAFSTYEPYTYELSYEGLVALVFLSVGPGRFFFCE